MCEYLFCAVLELKFTHKKRLIEESYATFCCSIFDNSFLNEIKNMVVVTDTAIKSATGSAKNTAIV